MAHDITIPRLGWNMEHGVFHGWLKQEGDAVRAGEAIFLLEGEKATEEIECLDPGILRVAPNAPKVGERVVVGQLIGRIAAIGEEVTFPEAAERAKPPSEPQRRVAVETATRDVSRTEIKSSPRARRAARELGVDWKQVHGTGATGRIRERDVRAAAETNANPRRRVIAERMRRSLDETAPVTLTTAVDATNLVNLRRQFKVGGGDVVPSYTDFLVKLVTVALQQHPQLTVQWVGERLVPAPALHIGFAVDTDAGLLVPVLRDVPRLGLRELALRSRELTERARQGKLSAAELQGGVFTVTNLGAFGIDAFTPIINYPECAVLGVGRIQNLPVNVGELIVSRERLTLSLTFDHRRIDGAPAARFVQTLSSIVENPSPHLMT